MHNATAAEPSCAVQPQFLKRRGVPALAGTSYVSSQGLMAAAALRVHQVLPGPQLPALDGLILLPALPGSSKRQWLTQNSCFRGAGDSPVGEGKAIPNCRNPSFLVCICHISPLWGQQGCHRPELHWDQHCKESQWHRQPHGTA